MKWTHSYLMTIYFVSAIYANDLTSFALLNNSDLYFFNQKWEFVYTLDLNEYFYTAVLLDECVENLKFICGTRKNNSCNYFMDSILNTKLEANSEIIKLQINSKQRRKRFAIFAVIMGVTIMALIAGLAASMYKVKQLETTLQSTVNMLNSSVNLAQSSTDLQESMIYNTDQEIYEIEKKIRNMTQQIYDDQAMNNLIFTVIFQILKYQTYQHKLNLLFKNNFKENLFDIVNFQNLSKTIDFINNNNLPSNFFIPQIKLGHGNKLIHAFWKIDETSLSIILHLPVLFKNKYHLREFIPLPFVNYNNTSILNEKTTLFFDSDSNIFNFTYDLESKYCMKQANLTACNSLILDDLEEISKCTKQLIHSNAKEYCLFEDILNKNYFLKMSDSLIYAFIIKPINILMQCLGFERKVFLNESRYIPFARDCNIFKHTYPYLKYPKITSINMAHEFAKPNLTFKPENSTLPLEKIPILNKHKRDFEKTREKINELRGNISIHKGKIDQIIRGNSVLDWLSDTWNSVRDLFSGTIFKFTIYVLICLIFVQICISMIKNIINKIF